MGTTELSIKQLSLQFSSFHCESCGCFKQLAGAQEAQILLPCLEQTPNQMMPGNFIPELGTT
jgi:hypothetical protein